MGRQARIKRQRRRPALDGEVPKRTLDRQVDLVETLRILDTHMSDALCEGVFRDVRDTERERRWSLAALARFWTAVILRNPKSLTEAFQEAARSAGKGPLFPEVAGTPQAFFDRSKSLRPDFFAGVFHRFVDSVVADSPPCFCHEFGDLRQHFPEVWVIDGSRLDAIAHRLKFLWNERAVMLPGSVTALYDLFRGIPRRFLFDSDAASAEIVRAHQVMDFIPRGTLVLADRGYSSVPLLIEFESRGLFCLFRLSKTVSHQLTGAASPTRDHDGGVLKDEFVELGSGKRATPQTVRLISFRKGSIAIQLVTNVLEPEQLPAEKAIDLYRERWEIERMYFDLKIVLGVQQFYAANPNAVAMQVYAAAIVYAAMRVSQARIADKNEIAPELISPAKFFPRMAHACGTYAGYLIGVRTVTERHPRIAKDIPDPTGLPEFTARLGDLLRQQRTGTRRARRFCKSRATWKSFSHVKGGRKLT
jgi:hypothetical protein